MVDEEQRQKSGQDSFFISIILIGAIVLSAVSFSTTMFGMLKFASNSAGQPGDQIVAWFISLGTTFGIQIIMLFMALQLGEQLVKIRPKYDDRYHPTLDPPSPKWPEIKRKIWGYGLAIFVFFLSATQFTSLSMSDIGIFAVNVATGDGSSQSIAGILMLVLGLVIVLTFRLIRNVWTMLNVTFLLVIYFGTLAVSSLFSFDSYYQILQDENDITQRRASIVRETTAKMLIDAEQSLSTARLQVHDGPEADKLFEDLNAVIDLMLATSDEKIARSNEDSEARSERATAQNKVIRAEIRRLEGERAKDIAALETPGASVFSLQREVRDLETAANRATAARDAAKIARDEGAAKIDAVKILLECENTGSKEGPCGNSSGRPNPVDRDGKVKPGAVTTGLNKDLKDLEVPQVTLESKLAAAEKIVEDANHTLGLRTISLQTAEDALAVDGGTTARSKQIREDYEERISALRSRLKSEGGVGDLANLDFANLSRALGAFKTHPSQETLAAFEVACRDSRDKLIIIGIEDAEIRSLNCQPPRMAIIASRGEDLDNASLVFRQQCVQSFFSETSEATDAPEKVETSESPSTALPSPTSEVGGASVSTISKPQIQSKSDNALALLIGDATDTATLRAIVSKARQCLNIANRGQEDVQEMTSRLTEVESIYLGESTDIRRSLEDLRRKTPYAIGAISAAVFFDILILVAGFLTANSRASVLHENPLNPLTDQVEQGIRNAALAHSTDGTMQNSIRRFLRYVEPSQISEVPHTSKMEEAQLYRNCLNRAIVDGHDIELVKAMMAAIPARYLKDVTFTPYPTNLANSKKIKLEQREAINSSIIALMHNIAYSDGPALLTPPSTSNVRNIYDRDSVVELSAEEFYETADPKDFKDENENL